MESAFSFPVELTAPNELRGQARRRILLTGSGFQMALAAAILLVLAVAGALWLSAHAERRNQRITELRHDGVQAAGTITSLQSSGSAGPTVNYTFTANGATFSGQASVPPELARAVSHAGSLPIRYLPADPAVNHPAAWVSSPGWAWLVAPVISATLGLLLLLPLTVERRMAMEGAPVLAVVSKCARGRDGYVVNYEFRSPSETKIKGRGWCKGHQERGEGVWVLYLPKDPRRNLPYPLNYWRVLE